MRVTYGSVRARFLIVAMFMASTIRALAATALWFGMAVGMPASAQIGADDMARMRQLRPGQSVFQTREGCGVVTREPNNPDQRKFTVEFWARSSWEGPCVDGLALGPGKLIRRNPKGETTETYEGWYYYGHGLGHGVVTSFYPGNYGNKSERFEWDGVLRARSVDRAEPLEPKENTFPMVLYRPQDRSEEIQYSLVTRCLEGEQPCVSEWRYAPNYFDGLKQLPCNGSCGSLWVEKAGPLITAFDKFAREHAADVAAVKQALDVMSQ